MTARIFACLALLMIGMTSTVRANADQRPPNIILILVDDLGYSDLSCYGSARIKTPRLDAMAAEGMRYTDFYSPAPVCTPTRAGLLTGAHPQRLSLGHIPKEKPNGTDAHVLYALSRHGLHPDETTIPEILKSRGYATAMLGKWHLGDMPEFLPTRQGFDSFFGTPYSNDMRPQVILRNETVAEEHPMNQDTMIDRYTEEAEAFIKSHKDKPFFLYLAHNMPHRPLHPPARFKGTSAGGTYGDVVEAIDWSVGRVLQTLKQTNLDEHTLVCFTSDNGPWHWIGEQGGYAFPLRAGKGTTYEGGMRVPFIARWPNKIPANTTSREPLSHLDVLPTIAKLTGASLPEKKIDGADISPILLGDPSARNPHAALYYYANGNLRAVRSGRWKYKAETTLQDETEYGQYAQGDAKVPPALYDMELDAPEQKNVIKDHPKIADRLQKLIDEKRKELGDHRLGIEGTGVRPCGRVDYNPRQQPGAPKSSIQSDRRS